MKQGEKIAIWGALGIVAALLGLTVVLEIGYQGDSGKARIAQAVSSGDPAMTALLSNMPADLAAAELPDPDSEGARLLTIYCVQCHGLPTPAMHTNQEWAQVLARMENYMRERQGSMLLRVIMPPKEDHDRMLDYLNSHAVIPLDRERFTDLSSAAGAAFTETCSQCHGAPDPAQHSADQWPLVVARMQSNMITAGKTTPDEHTLQLIIEYLQRHGA